MDAIKKTVKSLYFNDYFKDFTFTSLDDGLEETIKWFINNYETCRK